MDKWTELRNVIQELQDGNQDKPDVVSTMHFLLNFMHVKDTQEEKIPQYPCITCCSFSERAACCGCPREREWQKKYGKR